VGKNEIPFFNVIICHILIPKMVDRKDEPTIEPGKITTAKSSSKSSVITDSKDTLYSEIRYELVEKIPLHPHLPVRKYLLVSVKTSKDSASSFVITEYKYIRMKGIAIIDLELHDPGDDMFDVFEFISKKEYNIDDIVTFIDEHANNRGLVFSIQRRNDWIRHDINTIYKALSHKLCVVETVLMRANRVNIYENIRTVLRDKRVPVRYYLCCYCACFYERCAINNAHTQQIINLMLTCVAYYRDREMGDFLDKCMRMDSDIKVNSLYYSDEWPNLNIGSFVDVTSKPVVELTQFMDKNYADD
jgi:hypothetical protein